MNPSLPLLLAQTSGAWVVLWLILGAAAGAGGCWFLLNARTQAFAREKQLEADRILEQARAKRDETLREAEVQAQKKLLETMDRFEKETAETRDEIKQAEKRLAKREDNLDKKLDVLNTKEKKIEDAEERIAGREAEIAGLKEDLDGKLEEQRVELLRIADLTREEAREMALSRVSHEVEREAGQIVEKTLLAAEEQARDKARKITIEAIQRYAAEHTCEATVATVDVPSDDMKGRIIGREGRNIRAFEKATGVTVIVDDTPGVVSISCFDPIRKEVSRLALERLIKDGRIHPTRIEELIEETEKQVLERVMEAGKHAVLEVNLHNVPKKIVEALGRLQFRTSYGQNVLRHSIEVAFLTGMMAEELGLDGQLARRCGLLHDIGKALDHEQEGTHTRLGAEFCRRFNEHEAVVNAAEGHHGDVPAIHVFTPLVTAADAVSASRPGGRRESLERYIKRLQELEAIATGFDGVRQAYAVEAGREVRVIVDAVKVDDRSSLKLARDVAQQIEANMTYPGEIKVTVLREIRATEYAR